MTEKTAEQLAAEKAAAEKAKAEAKEKAKAEAEKAKAEKKAEKERQAAEKKAKKEQEAKDKLAKAEQAKAAKEAARQPEQNGIRRPKPETLCGKAWAIFDEVSKKNGSPASISESMNIAKPQGLNEANVRAEYARWRKFHGITGRVEAPKAAEPAAAATQAAQ